MRVWLACATPFTRTAVPALPATGLGAEATLQHFLQKFGNEMPASNGPRFWAFVTGGSTPSSLMGDWLTSAYDLNLSHAANSNAPNVELEAIALLRQLFGLPDSFSGTFVTGATMANFAGLALAREWAAQQNGFSAAQNGLQALPPIRVFSGEAHSSTYKALAMLGLGRASLQKVKVLSGNREAVEVAALEEALAAYGAPSIVVANAGTVNTVDFDDLATIASLKARYNFWLHVDAAFGGFAACSPKYASLLNGLTEADSITIDAHKWLNVPYDAAMLFTRHRDLQLAVFQNSGAYLGSVAEPPDFVHLSPENSRRLRALPAWFTLHAYGREGYQEIVERCCTLATGLGEKIAASAHFRLLAPVRLNVVCFTLAGEVSGERVQKLVSRLREDGRVFLTPTVYGGVPGLRAAFSNWRTTPEDVELAWQALVECVDE
ncbi:MAG: aspartate aminotransferase family protein [Anaerolineales bacterium]|nr:aspartate aminotransferase family protein [Anaerolineales bacterium]